jgi:hypothetical protein
MRLCESCVQSCPALPGKQAVVGVTILVESKSCRMLESRRVAYPNSRYETLAKVTGGGALVGKWTWDGKLNHARRPTAAPPKACTPPGLLSGMLQLDASPTVLGCKKCMESQRAFLLKSIGPCHELGIFVASSGKKGKVT